MTSRPLLVVPLLGLLLVQSPPPAKAAAPPSTSTAKPEPTVGVDYADAQRIATKRKVPLLVEFYTDW